MSEVAGGVTYGNFIRPGRQGILGLPMGVTLMGIPFVVLIVLMLIKSLFLAAFIVAILATIAASLMVLGKRQGRTLYARWMLVGAHKRKARRGDALYIAGPAGKVPDGTFSLLASWHRARSAHTLTRMVGPSE